MMAETSATARETNQADRDKASLSHHGAQRAGAMALQSDRSDHAAPQMFVRLTGSHLAKPRAQRAAAEITA